MSEEGDTNLLRKEKKVGEAKGQRKTSDSDAEIQKVAIQDSHHDASDEIEMKDLGGRQREEKEKSRVSRNLMQDKPLSRLEEKLEREFKRKQERKRKKREKEQRKERKKSHEKEKLTVPMSIYDPFYLKPHRHYNDVNILRPNTTIRQIETVSASRGESRRIRKFRRLRSLTHASADNCHQPLSSFRPLTALPQRILETLEAVLPPLVYVSFLKMLLDTPGSCSGDVQTEWSAVHHALLVWSRVQLHQRSTGGSVGGSCGEAASLLSAEQGKGTDDTICSGVPMNGNKLLHSSVNEGSMTPSVITASLPSKPLGPVAALGAISTSACERYIFFASLFAGDTSANAAHVRLPGRIHFLAALSP
eukprot:CAMPEP_0175061320 /NCGR_PEP_ID=MMETSP0052_2-20121109/13517_1 /TAXON_ID=51329 ORGANISM="Polytomella parva, Strain SAG 63-3" /NCGR_SAMPLE_ID=MMETSP0052_2 /ASSEMBLY_ACC=CAM_ASM_000194 /LENGTH=361 /DNA_ID=CAMNT_0016327157 /DNA_START=78 /DNA_END=1163 /DNA_ORIENTATION=-